MELEVVLFDDDDGCFSHLSSLLLSLSDESSLKRMNNHHFYSWFCCILEIYICSKIQHNNDLLNSFIKQYKVLEFTAFLFLLFFF